jgi:hypothetical protein
MLSSYDKAKYILDNLSDITEDEKHLCRKVLDDLYCSSPTSVRTLHELQVLFHQTEGFVRCSTTMEKTKKA